MSTRQWSIVVASSVLVLTPPSLALTQAVATPSDAYEFPVRPGTPEWRAMPRDKALASLQLPDAVRTALSTAGLLETCLRYPPALLYPVFTASADSRHRGRVAGLERRFNGFTELVSRRDAARTLLSRYRKADLDLESLASVEEVLSAEQRKENLEVLLKSRPGLWEGIWAMQRMEILEALLGDSRMLNQLSPVESRGVLCEALRKSRGTLVKSMISAQESTSQLAEAVVRHLEPSRLGPPDSFMPARPNVLNDARALLTASGGSSCPEK